MVYELTPDLFEGFLERFSDLHDSLIRCVTIYYLSREDSRTHLSVRITTYDFLSPQPPDTDWSVDMELTFVDVQRMIIEEKRKSSNVVIFSAAFDYAEDLIYCDLTDSLSKKDEKGNFVSEFLVVSKRCFWSLHPATDGNRLNLDLD